MDEEANHRNGPDLDLNCRLVLPLGNGGDYRPVTSRSSGAAQVIVLWGSSMPHVSANGAPSDGVRSDAAAADNLRPRERILLAARELFHRHGIRGVGVETIA